MDSTYLIRAAGCLLLAVGGGPASAVTISHVNAHPEIQMYSYPAGSSNGAGSVRDRAATFGAFSGFDQETQQAVFYPGSGLDPARRGSFILAADTSADVPTGLSPDRYQIESVRVTATLLGSLVFPPSFTLEYDNTLDSSESLTTAGGDDPGQPIELYGIGFQGDYQGISFDGQDPDGMQLGDVRWRQYIEGEEGYDPELAAGDQAFAPYQFYAVDAAGRDAENAVYGGYSATEPGNTTSQFTPEPFAIGKVYDDQGVEFTPGASVENGDVFVFEPDLGNEGIVAYLQESLSAGGVGFSVSSLHQPAGHTGSVPYPDFYLDDLGVGNNPDGAAPTIEIVVTVLEESLPGDYDNNGTIDTDDYVLWRSQYGSAGPEADGNGDGVVDAADYAVWRDASASMEQAASAVTAAAVPEPGAVSLLAMFALAGSFCGWVEWFIRPRRTGRGA